MYITDFLSTVCIFSQPRMHMSGWRESQQTYPAADSPLLQAIERFVAFFNMLGARKAPMIVACGVGAMILVGLK